MARKRRDKYDVSGNIEAQYLDKDGLVLVNKLNVADLETLQIAEEEALAKAYETLLLEVRTDTAMTCELIKHVHARIFSNIYEWAGRWRTVQISKPGVIWPAAQYLDQSMETFERDVLAINPASALIDDDSFCQGSAEIQGEFLAIHPFREGNARTIKLMNNLLAAQTGRPLLIYDSSEEGWKEYIEAAKASLAKKDYSRMETIIRQALRRAHDEQST